MGRTRSILRCLLLSLVIGLSSAAMGFNHESLEKIIRDHNVKSIEELLPLLPESLRSQYVLLWFSRAGQKATFQKPRVIMFTEDADFIFAINDGAMFGGHVIDTISFNHESHQFDFRRFEFKDSKPVFFSKNEVRCQACHEVHLRPNWDNYPRWFGAYGMDDDTIHDDKIWLGKIRYERDANGKMSQIKESSIYHDKDMGTEFDFNGGDALNEVESQELKRFNAERKQHPRYKYLIAKNDSELYPYSYNPGRDRSTAKVKNHPNAHFGALIYAWNFVQSAHLFAKSASFENNKLPLLAYFAKCPMTEDLVAKMTKTSPSKEEGFNLGREELRNYLSQVFGQDLMETYGGMQFKGSYRV